MWLVMLQNFCTSYSRFVAMMSSAVPGPCHGDMQQPALLVDFRRRSGAEIGGNAAVDDVENEDGLPFLPFGGMNCRKVQIVLVQDWHSCLITRRIRRVERQLSQKARPRRIARGDLFELQQVGLANGCIFINAFEMRFIPATCVPDLRGPAGLARTNGLKGSHELV